jgi:esterase/lipase
LLIAGVVLWVLTPAKLQPTIAEITLPDDLDAWLTTKERQADERYGLVPGTEKRITWSGDRERTPYSVLYLHGFSATRQETAPLAEIVASKLGANLFETRLTGHGRKRDALTDIRAEDWLLDAAEALVIASRLGERVIVIGTSTGATLAAAMLGHAAMNAVDFLVMISPNFAPHDPGASWLTRPAGPLLARLLVGDTRSWQPHNEMQASYWSTSYPTASAVEVMRLVDLANRKLPDTIRQRLLMFYSSKDTVVSAAQALSVFQRTAAPQKAVIEINEPGDPSYHVLAGDVLSDKNTGRLANDIVEFILHPAP